MPSGPQACFYQRKQFSMDIRRRHTNKLSKVNLEMVGNLSFGKPEISSLVKTDVKY